MSSTQIFLERDGDIVNIHFPGDVEFIDMSHDVVSDLIKRGVDILTYSNKFNPYKSNQKSEIMPEGKNDAKHDATEFEVIANRLDNCRGRVLVSTNLLRKCVDNLNGSEPSSDDEKLQITDSPGHSILSGLQRLLKELEDQALDLEHEQGRLSNLLNIHL